MFAISDDEQSEKQNLKLKNTMNKQYSTYIPKSQPSITLEQLLEGNKNSFFSIAEPDESILAYGRHLKKKLVRWNVRAHVQVFTAIRKRQWIKPKTEKIEIGGYIEPVSGLKIVRANNPLVPEFTWVLPSEKLLVWDIVGAGLGDSVSFEIKDASALEAALNEVREKARKWLKNADSRPSK